MTSYLTTAAPGPSAGRPGLPLTLGRRFALVLGVPVALIAVVVTGFNLVGNLGKASYPVSATLPIRDGHLTVSDNGGDVDLLGVPAAPGTTPGAARLTGTVFYSLARPTLFLTDGPAGGGASMRLGCPFLSMTNCALNAHVDMPVGTAVTAATGGGNMTVRGLSRAVAVSTGGGDVRASDLSGAVNASTGGGNVTVDRLSGTASLHTSGGDITGRDLTSRDVTAGTGGGNVTLTLTAVPRRLSVTTSGGDVTIIVPPGDYQVSTHTSGGSISAMPSDPHAVNVISVGTGGGNITVHESR